MQEKIDWVKNEEDGQGIVEYALILALVAMAVISSLSFLGVTTSQLYEKVTY